LDCIPSSLYFVSCPQHQLLGYPKSTILVLWRRNMKSTLEVRLNGSLPKIYWAVWRNHLSFWPCYIFRCNLHKVIFTFFVFLSYNYVLAAWYQLFLDFISKVVVYIAKSENTLVDFIIFQPLHWFVEFIVLCLKIFKFKLLTNYCLVKRTSKICIY
jgi:hypothetical protein